MSEVPLQGLGFSFKVYLSPEGKGSGLEAGRGPREAFEMSSDDCLAGGRIRCTARSWRPRDGKAAKLTLR